MCFATIRSGSSAGLPDRHAGRAATRMSAAGTLVGGET
jgi:hypothetical protein